jgi:hypothetical protein
MAITITVEQVGEDDPMVFNVVLEDAGGKSRHRITLSRSVHQKLTDGRFTPQQLVEAAFRFLTERESRSDILPSFDVNVIHLYFPDFEEALPRFF